MIIAGVIGRQAAGKDEVVAYLADRAGMDVFSAGDIVRALAEEEDVAPTREKLLDVAAEIISRRGNAFIADVLIQRIRASDTARAAVNGLRTPTDVKRFRDAFGDDFLAVAVTVSDAHERYRRGRDRNTLRDPEDYDRFLANEKAEDRLFGMHETLTMADVTLKNDGTLEQLHEQIEEAVMKPNSDRLQQA